jgi:S-DNA-T family DNA segregation ATPase FtsK/SpoIIIE
MNKAEDFALAAGCEKVLIQRVGSDILIYAANKERRDVDFKQTLDYIMRDEKARKAIIPIPLGVDFKGEHSFIDLVDCPHILLAGSTGSGKSVFEAAIVSILQVARSRKEIEVNLVDTKRIDLPLFRELPIVNTCCTTLMEYLQMMNEVLHTHDRRAEKLRSANVRSLGEYNTLVGVENALPRILILVDEFADLIMQDREMRRDKESPVREYPKADFLLQRIAQVGRATGIHCIAATQRTSVKVINGDIKANFPCRISLRLPTTADSITILGQGGAENLLGKGDLLLQAPASEEIKRYHGPFVKHEDILYVVAEYQQIKEMYRSIVA